MHALSLGAHFTDGSVFRGRSNHTHQFQPAHRSGEHEHHHRGGVRQTHESHAGGGSDNQGSLKQVLVNQIRLSLSQRFDLQQSSMTVAGATPDEQAGNDLAATVSTALNSANTATPTDAVATVDAVISSAIQQTARDLSSSSGNTIASVPSALDSAVAQLQDQLQSLFSAYLNQTGMSQAADGVTATGAKLLANANGQLEIHTQEGDTIMLSFASKSGISVQNLQANSGGTQLSGSMIQAFSRNRVTITVQGDLNASELQAVQDLVGQVNQLADGFFGGDVNAALSQAGGLNFDSTQLSDYSLHLALQQTFAAYGLDLALAPAAADGQAPTAANDSSGVTAMVTPTTDGNVPANDSSEVASPVSGSSDGLAANDGTATTKTAIAI